MTNMLNAVQSRIIQFLKRHAFNQYLKVHAVGTHNRFQPTSRLDSYRRVIKALMQYPLPRSEAIDLIEPLEHPQALKTSAAVESSLQMTRQLGLPAHKGKEKNWDFLSAFALILSHYQSDAVIADLGTGPSSVILEWLNLYGYIQLHGCDFITKPRQDGHIHYTSQDLVKTTYPDNFADVITCLSVIEHGVDPQAFLQECKRLLKPDGLLIVSTDYWCEPTTSDVIEDEHGPVTLYNPEMIQAFFDFASETGFDLQGQPDFDCGDVTIHRPDVPALHNRYTFYFMAFRPHQGYRS